MVRVRYQQHGRLELSLGTEAVLAHPCAERLSLC